MTLLGLDVGTAACKGLLLDPGEGITGTARRDYPLSFPAPGRVELDPGLVWDAVRDVVGELAARAGAAGRPVRALTFSVSCDEAVAVDAEGRALGPCIMALDTRSSAEAERFERTVGRRRIYELTGLPVHAMFPLVRLLWLREHEPAVFRRTARFLAWHEYLALRLGLEPVGDPSVAARTLAYDIRARAWSDELLAAAGLRASLFARVQPSGTAIGELPAAAAGTLGLGAGVRLVTGGMDQSMAALGSGAIEPGAAMVGTGTWQAVTVVAEAPILTEAMLASGFAFGPHIAPDRYAAMATNASGGSLLRWARDVFAPGEPYERLLPDRFERPTDLLVLPHFEGSVSPWMDPASRGAIVGLDLATGRQELLQAIIEGVTFELRENLERMEAGGLAIRDLRATGGGARSTAWLQLKADATGRPVSTVNIGEPGAFAAACLAGVGAGVFASVAEPIARFVRTTATYEPRPPMAAAYGERFARYRRLYPALSGLDRPTRRGRAGAALPGPAPGR